MKKYAVCIVGQFRTFHQDNVSANILSAIQKIKPQSDVFFVFGEQPVTDLDKISRQFNPINISYYNTETIGAVNERMHGVYMACGWKKLYSIILDQEKLNGYQYEMIVKLRPDVMLRSYFHDKMPVETKKAIVYSDYLGGCGGTVADCINDCTAIITRPAMKSYLNDFYDDFYRDNTFTKLQCPECKLGWTLNNCNVHKGVAKFGDTIIRPGQTPVQSAPWHWETNCQVQEELILEATRVDLP